MDSLDSLGSATSEESVNHRVSPTSWPAPIREVTLVAGGAQGQIKKVALENGLVLAAKIFSGRDALKQLQREFAQFTAVGQHPHFPACHGIKEIGHDLCLVFDFIEGTPLSHLGEALTSLMKTGTEFSQSTAAAVLLARQLFAGLSHLEQLEIAHCDIKPENLILDSQLRLHIVDLGMAKAFSEERKSSGSFSYLPPELTKSTDNARPMNHSKVDSYSAANVILGIATGLKLGQDFETLVPVSTGGALSELVRCIYKTHVERRLSANTMDSAEKPELHLSPTGRFFGSDPLFNSLLGLLSQCLHSNWSDRPSCQQATAALNALVMSPHELQLAQELLTRSQSFAVTQAKKHHIFDLDPPPQIKLKPAPTTRRQAHC